MKRPALLLLALAWLTACETHPLAPTLPGPSFDVISNERFPFFVIAFNPCPPSEFVLLSGEAHEVVESDPDKQTLHINWANVKGTGLLTGATYTAGDNATEKTYTFPPQVESQEHFRLIRQGSLDNFDFFLVFRFPPFEIVRARMECQG